MIGNIEDLIRYINDSDLEPDLKTLFNHAIECELANRPISKLQEMLEEIATKDMGSK